MTASRLIWQITWRSALRIFGLGALFGGIYGPSVVSVLLFADGVQQGATNATDAPMQLVGVMIFAAVVGAVIGAALGCIVGILLGLLISAITIRTFLPLHDASRYRAIVQWSSTLLGGISTLVGTPLVSRVLFGDVTLDDLGMLAIFSVVPALLAGLAIWRGSGQLATWYVRTVGAPPPQQNARIAS